MKGFKQCENGQGHFYKEALDSCPYCPQGSQSSGAPKTEILGGAGKSTDSTQEATSNVDTLKTQAFGNASSGGGNTKTKPISTNQNFDATKTMITGVTSDDSEEEVQVSRRRLRGWLVSFDIEKFGLDFRIVEGRNTIGSNSSNDITVQDNEVSRSHGLILCKKDKFIITDELSANGTLVNGEELSPREPFDLNDGDEIKIGNTNLLFKTAFKK